MDFFIDNVRVRTVQQSSSYAMQFMLGIYELPDQLNAQSLGQQLPKTMEVDYFRGYQPVTGYKRKKIFT